MSPELITFLVAMTPIAELRGAIPLALWSFHLPVEVAFFWAVLGNVIPVIFILLLLEPVSKYLSDHFYYCNRFFAWLFDKTRKDHSESFEVWGALALVIFVAIPLPMTGGWSGAVAAFVFGIPFRKSLPLITIGISLAAGIVTLVSLGVLAL